jgi:hypothetical protein
MNWEALGAVGEIVGAVAVVVTLVYLALQIRQNSRLIKASTHQGASEWVRTVVTLTAQDAETARVFTQGLSDPRSLEDSEQAQFAMLMFLVFAGYQNFFEYHRDGAIGEVQWRNGREIIRWYLSQPGAQLWWHRHKDRISDDFVAYAEANLMPPPE